MAIAPILAMTAAEIRNISILPGKIAWMACHFSPYGTGLSNLPKELPPGSVLIVDDITPPHRHDPVFIAKQLTQCVETLQCSAILLDFQRSGCEKTQTIAKHLVSSLPCPVVVSEFYAGDQSCPVFLSPVPPSTALETHILPWESREIWLEICLEGEILTLTENGCETTPFPYPDPDAAGFTEEKLHCHYKIETNEKSARFTLWRTKEDMENLLEEVETVGISGVVGLYQEWNKYAPLQSLPCVKGGGQP